jgi:anhydro-N-acetylmuramic acid kinase
MTLLPPLSGAEPDLTAVRAFDTGPGVCVIDGVTRLLRPGLDFDRNGALAARGTPIESVIEERLRDPWFDVPPPKSTGRERYTPAYIADFIERFVPQPVEDVLLSGGGARNPVLREAIAMALSPRLVRPFGELYFDGDAKEGVAFAFLGWLHLRRAAGNVPGATGARGPRVLGAHYPA